MFSHFGPVAPQGTFDSPAAGPTISRCFQNWISRSLTAPKPQTFPGQQERNTLLPSSGYRTLKAFTVKHHGYGLIVFKHQAWGTTSPTMVCVRQRFPCLFCLLPALQWENALQTCSGKSWTEVHGRPWMARLLMPSFLAARDARKCWNRIWARSGVNVCVMFHFGLWNIPVLFSMYIYPKQSKNSICFCDIFGMPLRERRKSLKCVQCC